MNLYVCNLHLLTKTYRNLLDSPVPLPSLEQHDVSLLRFYASRTSLTLASSRTLEIWQSHALEDVKSHTYVMHGILALSALHQCYIEPIHSARYASLASRHHESAAMTFRAQVADISPGNSHTVAIFTLLMAIFSYGVPSVRGFPADISPISMFVNVLGVVRQAWSALGPERQKIEQGFLRPILDPHMSPRRPLGDDSQQLLEDLQAYLETSDDTPENKAAYLEAMIQLEGYFWRLPNFSPLSDVFGWPMIVSDRFFQLLIDKKPFALFCLAYIMVPLYHSPNVWLGPWALPILKEIWVTLDEPLRRFIDWPAQYLRLLPHAAHPKECQCFDCYIEEKSPGFVWKEHAAPLLSRTASL